MEFEAKGVPTYGGRYVQYNIMGNLFEVSATYVPPINPVGRGAYGIVWYYSPFTFQALPFLCIRISVSLLLGMNICFDSVYAFLVSVGFLLNILC